MRLREAPVALAVVVAAACGATPLEPAGDVTWSAVAAGAYHTCGLSTDGVAFCWGSNEAGQLGLDSRQRGVEEPSRVAGGVAFVALSAGWRHTCGLDRAGDVWCWGDGSSGQLGAAYTSSRRPRRVPGLAGATAIASGAGHTCAVGAEGAVHCWGANDRGQLGNRSGRSSPLPVAVPASLPMTAVTAGGGHSCGLTAEGAVLCWGDNARGQLGIATVGGAAGPLSVSPRGAPFTAITSGGDHSCAPTDDGRAWCWGDNGRGELTPGGGPPVLGVPTEVAVPGTVSAVRTGPDGLTCALNGAGAWSCWGLVDAGVGAATVLRPVTLRTGDEEIVSIAVGGSHACGLSRSGAILCWGAGAAGQLGSGRVDFLDTPTRVG